MVFRSGRWVRPAGHRARQPRRPGRLLFAAALLLAVISGCSLSPGFQPALPREEPVLKVAVLTNITEAELSATTKFFVRRAGGAETLAEFGADAPVEFRVAHGEIEISEASRHFQRTERGPLMLVPAGDGAVTVEGSRYRGGLEIALNARGSLNVVNRVGLEDYLRGVVPNEIGHKEPALLEAVKAQAVAARTYALAYRGRYAGEGFDLLSTVADQVYTGIEGEEAASDRAVRDTRGLVAVSHGEPIMTNYFSTCGGHTASREEVWDKPPLSYLSGVSDKGGPGGFFCSGSKYFRWRETWSGEEFLRIVRDNLRSEMDVAIAPDAVLHDVHVEKRGPSGRVRSLLFRTSRGDYRAGGDRLRWIVERPGGAGPLWSILFDVKVRRSGGRVTEVVFEGHGWGHGVGMCQWGAMERSRRGQGFAEILRHYYSGIRLAKLY